MMSLAPYNTLPIAHNLHYTHLFSIINYHCPLHTTQYYSLHRISILTSIWSASTLPTIHYGGNLWVWVSMPVQGFTNSQTMRHATLTLHTQTHTHTQTHYVVTLITRLRLPSVQTHIELWWKESSLHWACVTRIQVCIWVVYAPHVSYSYMYYIYIYTHAHTYIRTHLRIHTRIGVCDPTRVLRILTHHLSRLATHTNMLPKEDFRLVIAVFVACMCMCMCMIVYVHACVCVCMYIYIYICVCLCVRVRVAEYLDGVVVN
jgi:hypothetical protein